MLIYLFLGILFFSYRINNVALDTIEKTGTIGVSPNMSVEDAMHLIKGYDYLGNISNIKNEGGYVPTPNEENQQVIVIEVETSFLHGYRIYILIDKETDKVKTIYYTFT